MSPPDRDEGAIPSEETPGDQESDFHPESGWTAARALLALPRPPIAIFACNDLVAFGVLLGAAELGRCVPKNPGVVSYDDIDLSRYTISALTTIAKPKHEMVREAL